MIYIIFMYKHILYRYEHLHIASYKLVIHLQWNTTHPKSWKKWSCFSWITGRWRRLEAFSTASPHIRALWIMGGIDFGLCSLSYSSCPWEWSSNLKLLPVICTLINRYKWRKREQRKSRTLQPGSGQGKKKELRETYWL